MIRVAKGISPSIETSALCLCMCQYNGFFFRVTCFSDLIMISKGAGQFQKCLVRAGLMFSVANFECSSICDYAKYIFDTFLVPLDSKRANW